MGMTQQQNLALRGRVLLFILYACSMPGIVHPITKTIMPTSTQNHPENVVDVIRVYEYAVERDGWKMKTVNNSSFELSHHLCWEKDCLIAKGTIQWEDDKARFIADNTLHPVTWKWVPAPESMLAKMVAGEPVLWFRDLFLPAATIIENPHSGGLSGRYRWDDGLKGMLYDFNTDGSFHGNSWNDLAGFPHTGRWAFSEDVFTLTPDREDMMVYFKNVKYIAAGDFLISREVYVATDDNPAGREYYTYFSRK